MSITLINARGSVRNNLNASNSEINDERIDDLINQAIDFSNIESLLVPVVSEAIAQVEDTYEYSLSTGETANMRYITAIAFESETTGLFAEWADRTIWSIRPAATPASTPYLYFDRGRWFPEDAKYFRVEGLKPHARVSDPEDVIYLPESYIIWKATAFGHGILMSTVNSPRARWHEARMPVAEQLAELARMGSKHLRIPSYARLIPGR